MPVSRRSSASPPYVEVLLAVLADAHDRDGLDRLHRREQVDVHRADRLEVARDLVDQLLVVGVVDDDEVLGVHRLPALRERLADADPERDVRQLARGVRALGRVALLPGSRGRECSSRPSGTRPALPSRSATSCGRGGRRSGRRRRGSRGSRPARTCRSSRATNFSRHERVLAHPARRAGRSASGPSRASLRSLNCSKPSILLRSSNSSRTDLTGPLAGLGSRLRLGPRFRRRDSGADWPRAAISATWVGRLRRRPLLAAREDEHVERRLHR